MIVLLLRYYSNSTVFSAKHKGAQEIFCVDFKERVVYYREKAFYESISPLSQSLRLCQLSQRESPLWLSVSMY